MKKSVFLLSILLSTSVFAEECVEFCTRAEIEKAKKTAVKKANMYAEAVHCSSDNTNKNQVFHIKNFSIHHDYLGSGDHAFFVDNHVTYNCMMGSGTHGHILTLVLPSDAGQLYVAEENVLPNINTKFINSYKQQGNKLIIQANEYAEDDPNCCGSLKYEHIFNLSTLKLEKSTFLGKE